MPLVCLIGRHGAGKSALGAALACQGARHLSVGLLRRLAHSGCYPADVPAPLVAAIGRLRPGAPLPPALAEKLLRFAGAQRGLCVIDGFPASAAHLALLPPGALLAYLWTPALPRQARLLQRAASSRRQWQPGRRSEREAQLAALAQAARTAARLAFVPNRGTVEDAARRLLARLAVPPP